MKALSSEDQESGGLEETYGRLESGSGLASVLSNLHEVCTPPQKSAYLPCTLCNSDEKSLDCPGPPGL